ncbi:hypothetical protein [Larkinella ripae]
MITSIRSYFRLSRLAKALSQAQNHQYANQAEAMRVCNRLFSTGKDYSVVRHQSEPLFWVVQTKFVKPLLDEGHVALKPYKNKGFLKVLK